MTREHMVTQEELKELMDYDPETGVFVWKVNKTNFCKKGRIAGTPDGHGYRQMRINTVFYKAHRLAWLYVHGVWPKGEIDHINHIKDDNRIQNLRDVTRSQNGWNKPTHKKNTSGHIGVHWRADLKKWRARLCVDYKQIHIGLYDTAEEASAAYLRAKSEVDTIHYG